MTFLTDVFLTDVMKKEYSENEIFAVLVESEQDRKRRQALAKVTETVAAYRLKEIKAVVNRKYPRIPVFHQFR